jgi:hypothetical protein
MKLFDLPVVANPGSRIALTIPIRPDERATFLDGSREFTGQLFANYYRSLGAVWVQAKDGFELFV